MPNQSFGEEKVFDIDEHERRMKELLSPKPQVSGNDLLTRFRGIAKKRKNKAILPPVIDEEI